jgi:hypothetical protein
VRIRRPTELDASPLPGMNKNGTGQTLIAIALVRVGGGQ